jgi:RHS repeat-associated protein
VDDGSLAVHYEYDEDGRIRDISYPSLGKRLRYEYDRAGHLSRFTDAEGSVYDYEYGPDGELTAIRLPEGGEIRFRHDPLARRTIVEYPNGIKGIRDENAEGRATMIAYYDREEKLALGWRYAHDAAGNVVAVTDNAGKTSRYRYDASGQLLSEEGPKGKTSIAYFPGGNRKQVVKGNKTVLYRYDKVGKLVKAGSESFLYDARGNVVERKGPGGVTRYAFDAENRLVRVARPGGEDVTFGYSGTGERIWRRDKSGMTYFLTDGMNLVAELDGEMKVKASYLHAPGIDRPLVMRREGTTYYYHPRDLGTIAALTDSKGNVAATYDTDAFGGPTASAGRAFSPFLFTARELEADLGLYYCRDRYYDPSLGRFVSRDPILGEPPDPLSFPPYIYARNNPLSYSDPTGRGARYGGPWEHPRIFGQPGPMYLRPQVLDLIPRGDIKAWEWEYIKREHDYLVREGLGEADNYKRQLIARLNERTPAPSSRQSRLGNIYGRVKNAVVQAGAWAERKFNQIVRPEVYRNPTVQVNRSAAGSATGGGTVQANRPSTPPGPPRPGPAGSAPAGPAAPPRAPTPAQMAARTGAAVGAAAMGLDYWACREEGKSHEECLKELGRNMAIGTVISGGVVAAGGALGGAHALAAGGGVVAGALAGGAAVGTALAVTAPIVATVGAAAATVRLSEAIGNRPAVEAQERLHQFRQVNLEGLGVSLAALRDQMDRDLAALDGMRDAHSKLCADISSQVQRSWQTSTSISPVGISAKVEKIKKAAAGCTATDTPPGPADLQGIASRAKAQEDSVIRCVDSAGRLDCKTKEDADRVRQAYSACRQYLQQLENLEKTVRDRFRQQGSAGTGMSVIRPLLSEAEREFDTLVRLVDETSRIASELPGKVEKLKALQAGFDAKKAESFKRLKYLSESMPRRAPAADTEQAKRYAEAQELVFRSGAALDGRTLPACDLTKYSQYETAFISKGRLGGLFVEWKLEAERSMKEGRDAAAACEERENAVLRPITDSLSRARLALQNAEARVRDCTARASGQGPADGAPGSSGDGFGSAGEGTTEATASGSERAERSGTDGFGPGGIGQTTDRTGDLSLLGTDTGSTGSSTTVTGGGPGFGPAGSGRTDPVSPAPSWSPPLSHGDQIGARGQPVAPDAYRWYVMCDRANGTVVFGKDWDPARHVILAGPFEGPRTAQNWIGLNCPAARCNAQGACTAGAPYAAAAGGNWYVMCNRHDGTIVYGQHPDVSRQFILAGPLPGAQDATNWIAAVCPSARCTQTGACASGPVGGGNWYVLCNRDDGNVVMSKNVDPSRQIVWQGNLRGEWDARQWISMNCPSARCDRNGRCTQQAAPVPVPAKPPQPGPAIGQRPGDPSDFCNEQYRRFQDALRNNQARYANDILQASRGCWFYSDGTRALQQVQSKPPVQSKPQTAQLPGKPGPAVTPTPAPPKPAPACNRRAKCESWDARGRRWVLSTGYGGGFGREVEVGGACTAARQTRCWDDCDKRWRCYETR